MPSDFTLPPPFAWCEIPAGQVILGAVFDDDSGAQEPTLTVKVPRFRIAKYPITNAQFAQFIEAGGYQKQKYWTKVGWRNCVSGIERGDHPGGVTGKPWSQPLYWDDEQWNGTDYPVVGISWHEAFAFCRWLSEVWEAKVSLPTEQQWQRAAQGDETYVDLSGHGRSYPGDTLGRAYPWGNEWDASRCNNNADQPGIGRTTPVRQYEGKGDSPFGVVDMTGNVSEWCLTTWRASRGLRGTNTVEGDLWRVVRGGSWQSGLHKVESRWIVGALSATVTYLADYRNAAMPIYIPHDTGFRIAYEEAAPQRSNEKTAKKARTVISDAPILKAGAVLPESRVKAMLPKPFDWCEIPAGNVTLRKRNVRPKASDAVAIPIFYIAKYPVTNAQFKLFVEAGGYQNSDWWIPEGWQARTENLNWDTASASYRSAGVPWSEPYHWQDPQFNGADQPVATISWYEAMAFCTWLSESSGENVTLPTIEQWQRAAQGDDGRAYPWGSLWDASRCNNNVDGKKPRTGGPTPVQQYEGRGDSPFGVVNMAGNIAEWCLTEYASNDDQSYRRFVSCGWSISGLTSYRVDQNRYERARLRGFNFGFRIAWLPEEQ